MTDYEALRSKQAVSTVDQSRNPIFLPYEKLSGRLDIKQTVCFEGQTANITLKDSKLTQIHRNICDVIFSNYEPITMAGNPNGDVVFVFPKYDLLKKLGHKTKKNDKWLKEMFEDMRKATVIVEDFEKGVQISDRHRTKPISRSHQGIINLHRETLKTGSRGQPMYGVQFTGAFMRMFEESANIYSAELTPSIISLKHGSTKAFVRYCITNEKLNKDLDSILRSIGFTEEIIKSSRAFRKKRGEILEEKEYLLEQFGIDIRPLKSNPRKFGVFYTKHPSIYIVNPESSKQETLDL